MAEENSAARSLQRVQRGKLARKKTATIKMRHTFIKGVFSQFTPPSQKGHMDLIGLKQFLTEFPKQSGVSIDFVEKDVQRIMKSFDEDQNGSLEEREFVHWLSDGLDQAHEDRVIYAQTSALGAKLVSLIDTVKTALESKLNNEQSASDGPNYEGKADDPPSFVDADANITAAQGETHVPDEHNKFVSRFAAHHGMSVSDLIFCDTVTQLKKNKENIRIVIITHNGLMTFVAGEDHNAHKKSKSVLFGECVAVKHVPKDNQVELKVTGGKKMVFRSKFHHEFLFTSMDRAVKKSNKQN